MRSPRRIPIGNQRDAIAKTCRSKRAYSFLICTRTLSNSALAARAARSASRAAPSAKVHCQATSGSLPSPPGCLTNISPAGSPIARRTAEALRRTSRTSAAKPGLAKYCVRSTILMGAVGVTCPVRERQQEMRPAERRLPLLDAEKFDGEISWRHLLEFYVMRRSHRCAGHFAERNLRNIGVGCGVTPA